MVFDLRMQPAPALLHETFYTSASLHSARREAATTPLHWDPPSLRGHGLMARPGQCREAVQAVSPISQALADAVTGQRIAGKGEPSLPLTLPLARLASASLTLAVISHTTPDVGHEASWLHNP